VRLWVRRLGVKGLEVRRAKCHALVVGNLALDLALEQRLAVAVNGLDLLVRVVGLPVRPVACWVRALGLALRTFAPVADHADLDDVEQQVTTVIPEFRELAVEIPAAHRRANENRGRAPHLHKGHNHLVEHAQVHVCGLFAVNDVAAHAAQRLHLQSSMSARERARERAGPRVLSS